MIYGIITSIALGLGAFTLNKYTSVNSIGNEVSKVKDAFLQYTAVKTIKIHEENALIYQKNIDNLINHNKDLAEKLLKANHGYDILPEKLMLTVIAINIIIIIGVTSLYLLETYLKSTTIGKFFFPKMSATDHDTTITTILNKIKEYKKTLQKLNDYDEQLKKEELEKEIEIQNIKREYQNLDELSDLKFKCIEGGKLEKNWFLLQKKKDTYIDYITAKGKLTIAYLYFTESINKIKNLKQIGLAQKSYLNGIKQQQGEEYLKIEYQAQEKIRDKLVALIKKLETSYQDFNKRLDIVGSETFEIPYIEFNIKNKENNNIIQEREPEKEFEREQEMKEENEFDLEQSIIF